MRKWLGAGAASALLVVAALILAFSRSPGVDASDPAPSAAPSVPEVSAVSPKAGSVGQARPRGSAELPATHEPKKPVQRQPRSAVSPFRPSPIGMEEIWPPWYESLLRPDQSASLAGAALGPQTLPTEITDPPASLVVPPLPPVVAADLEVDDIGPYSAVVTFTTDQEVSGIVGFGWDAPVSFASDDVGREHRIELHGLVPDSEYVVRVFSHTGTDDPELEFFTDSRPLSPDASTAEGTVQLDGQPFFPVTAYGACASQVENLLDAGVNVFGWDHSCGSDSEDLLDSIAALDDRAYWTVPWPDRTLADDGHIGYTQPDEPDGLGLSPAALPVIDESDKVTFLTLTQHFAPGTGDLPWQYPGYYEGFVPKADVFGVDFYPLQGLCSPEKLALNHDVQVELLRLTGGKPTLQWIETAEMNCPGRVDAAITPETLRAEMFLAIAGGANGLGLFPSRLSVFAALAARTTLDTIEQAWPMLMTSRLPVEIAGEGAPVVRASARVIGGGTMIVVANASTTQSASVELRLEGSEDGQRFLSVDDDLVVTPVEGVLALQLEPLEAHILVAGPVAYEESAETVVDD